MKLSLSEISTIGASFEEDVAAYAGAGFDGIGIWELKLPEGDSANVALLRDAGLEVATCVPAIPSILPMRLAGFDDPADPRERIDALVSSMHRLAAYEPESVLCLTGPGEGPEDWDLVVEGLREVAAAARAAGVRLGLEPANPAQRETVSFLNTISATLEVLEIAELPDVGLMADTYHLWHESPDELARIADRVTGLHVADVPVEPDRADRALPGESGRRASAFLRALVDAGWNGFVDVEIFSTPTRFWGLSVENAAARAYAAASALVQTVPSA